MRAIRRGYSVNDPDDCSIAVDWRWPLPDNPTWTMSQKEGQAWEGGDPLTEYGRQILLEHFELLDQADDLPLERIAVLSPADLESRCQKPVRQHQSSRMGDHVAASAVL